MLAKVSSATVVGLEALKIEVEVDVASRGFPTLTIVGLPNKAVDEAKDRVRTAITNAGYQMPDSRITVNLAPADIPKIGSGFDLPIAIGILAASGHIPHNSLQDALFLGELSLEGLIRKVPGIISVSLLAKREGIQTIYIPQDNADEASIISDTNIYAPFKLSELIAHLQHKIALPVFAPKSHSIEKSHTFEQDFIDIKGQEQAKRALEIAAAGFHNIHLLGSPGAGKTMLSRAFPSITSSLDKQEMLEVSQIYSIAGMLQESSQLYLRPFRAPHHTISRIGLIGGGTVPSPGEISLAHRGVLFLDEFTEFPQAVLEALRQPLEDGTVTISRAAGRLTFPCRFLLLAASNPCPCGFQGHPKKKCTCHPNSIQRYTKKLSGPLLDRIDLHITVPPVEEETFFQYAPAESSTIIKERVLRAQAIQQKRFQGQRIHFNSEMSSADVKHICKLSVEGEKLLQQAVSKLSLSGRSYMKIIKIAQTIADISQQETISVTHVAEALQYRSK